MLKLENLEISFATNRGSLHAVKGVSLDIDAGESIGIVGESGSGKTVLSRASMGLLAPTATRTGTVTFDGKEISSLSREEVRETWGTGMAMIFQDPMTSLNPFLTVGEQLIEPLIYHPDKTRIQTRSNARLRAIELLDEVGIIEPEKRFDCYPHEFSGGMRQRVMIAMALINEPRLLICDEPTTALDVTIQAQILKLLLDLCWQHNISMIFISHDLAVVRYVADRIAVMQKGQIVELGNTEALLKNPQHHYTQTLLAARLS